MTNTLSRIAGSIGKMLGDEHGGITVLNLQIFLVTLAFGSLAIDFASGMSSKTQLQVTADAAAHAALITREQNSPAAAKAKAVQIAAGNMPLGKYGSVLTENDVVFGTWNRATQKFVVDPNSRNAVMVTTKQHQQRGNGVRTFLAGIVGQNAWDVTSASVFETYLPPCFREGFVAKDRVEMQSNGYFTSGFCIHSQSYVSVASNNTFESNVIVSMPDKRDLKLPNSGFSSNSGLQAALRDASYQLRILNRIDNIIAGALNPNDPNFGVRTQTSPYYRSYITNPAVQNINVGGGAILNKALLKKNRVNHIDCKSDKTHKLIDANFDISDMVIVTDCRLMFITGAKIENTVVITTNTDPQSLFATGNIVFGKNDNCAAGGDVQLVSKGGAHFAANVSAYNTQVIAADDISMTANTNGVKGISLVAGGKIDVTSNGAYGNCNGAGMNNNYVASYFRLAG